MGAEGAAVGEIATGIQSAVGAEVTARTTSLAQWDRLNLQGLGFSV
jgi:hypothetical protein